MGYWDNEHRIYPTKYWFFGIYTYETRRSPIIERGRVQQSKRPYQRGICLMLRLPLQRKAFYIGRWTEDQPFEEEDGIEYISMRAVNWEEAVHRDSVPKD